MVRNNKRGINKIKDIKNLQELGFCTSCKFCKESLAVRFSNNKDINEYKSGKNVYYTCPKCNHKYYFNKKSVPTIFNLKNVEIKNASNIAKDFSGIWFSLIIIGFFLAYLFIAHYSNISYNDIEVNPTIEDALITSCNQAFNECKKITEAKYGASVSINEIRKFTDIKSSMEFYNSWRDISWQPPSSVSGEDYIMGTILGLTNPNEAPPFVLIAVKASSNTGRINFVVACDKTGKLTKLAKSALLCG